MDGATFANTVLGVELSPAQQLLARDLQRRAFKAGRRCGRVLSIGNPTLSGSFFDAFRELSVGETRYMDTFSAPKLPPETDAALYSRTVLSSHRYGMSLAASNAALTYSIRHVDK